MVSSSAKPTFLFFWDGVVWVSFVVVVAAAAFAAPVSSPRVILRVCSHLNDETISAVDVQVVIFTHRNRLPGYVNVEQVKQN